MCIRDSRVGAQILDIERVSGKDLRDLAHDADAVVTNQRELQPPIAGLRHRRVGDLGSDAKTCLLYTSRCV